MTDLHMIRTEADYQAALAEYEGYFDNEPAPGSPKGDRFELLGLLLSKYEEETTPVGSDAVDTVSLVMEQRGHSRAELIEILGSRSRASEFLNRRRELTLSQIRRLHTYWRIPTDALIGHTGDVEDRHRA